MTNTNILSNETFVGALATATMIPESDIYLENCTIAASDLTTVTVADSTVSHLVPNLYVGCMAKIHGNSTKKGNYLIKSNTTTTITFAEDVAGANSEDSIDVTIYGFGAPCPAPPVITGKPTLLADNWLGLVNTLTPPSVEVEIGQINLAGAATRNIEYQFKKNETVSGGSLDFSVNNGSWLYYALGDFTVANSNHTLASAGNALSGTGYAVDLTHDKFLRVIGGAEYPPQDKTDVHTESVWDDNRQMVTEGGSGYWTYNFTESNGDSLPSFALEVTYEKGDLADANYYVGSEGGSTDATAKPFKDIYSRVFTGCQVNTLTLNFEEGQELRGNVDLVTRRAFDAPDDYSPKRRVRTATGLFNYASSDADVRPYMFSQGTVQLYGQTLARVKTGSVTISNNIAQARYIGQYDRGIMSNHIPAQRTYEISLTMEIVDTKLWDNLRADGEHQNAAGDTTLPYDGKIMIKFEKDSTDYIELAFTDYITQSLDIPFPEDKGPIDVAATFSARTLQTAKYVGNWKILHSNTGL
tara:strand:- start:10485 stop:12065 length:1581 start_codon:yes stop_codon:yes gene_type:complete